MNSYVVHVTEVRRITLRCEVEAENEAEALALASDGDCYDEAEVTENDYDVLDRQAFAAELLTEGEALE